MEKLNKRVKIAFHVNEINFRGTTTPVVDYIRYGRQELGIDGIIVHPNKKACVEHHPLGFAMCREHKIQTIEYPSGMARMAEPPGFDPHVDRIIKEQNCNVCYIMKGRDIKDGRLSKVVPNLCHGWGGLPHDGDVRAATSFAGAGQRREFYVPTIVEENPVKGDLRGELNIPPGATVFGNLGGSRVFSLGIGWRMTYKVASERPDLFFIHMGIDPHGVICDGNGRAGSAMTNFFSRAEVIAFKKLKNVIYLPAAIGERKYKFINTCDAMLHARKQGEMGGSAVAEFNLCNKPVLTSPLGGGGHRLDLKDKALIYKSDEELYDYLTKWDRAEMAKKDWIAPSYTERRPGPCMKIFKERFLDPIWSKIQ